MICLADCSSLTVATALQTQWWSLCYNLISFLKSPYSQDRERMFSFSWTGGITHIKQWISPLISAFLTHAPWRAFWKCLGAKAIPQQSSLLASSIRNRDSQPSLPTEVTYGPAALTMFFVGFWFFFLSFCFVFFQGIALWRFSYINLHDFSSAVFLFF